MADTGQQVSYGELERRSNQCAHLLRAEGLRPGDGIAVWLPNDVRYLQICWAAQRSGLYYTPISTLFQAQEIEYIINNSDAGVLITSRDLLGRIDIANVHAKIFVVDDEPPPGCHSFVTETERQPTQPIADESEGAEMIYSSGTTGQPKGVRFPLTARPLGELSTVFQTRIRMHNLSGETRYLSTAPLYHSAPLRYNLIVTRLGGTSVIMPRYDATTALDLIDQHAITHSQWVPTMFVRMLKLPAEVRDRFDGGTHQYAIHAAAPCPVNIKQRMLDWWGPILYEYYSGTEANGATAITPDEWRKHPGSVGKAFLGELHVLDDDGNEVSPGTVGTVYFGGGPAFEYHKDPEKTALVRNENGWSTLGDMGLVDADGYLFLRDRKSFMIISGGVNIYPQEIENTLIDHPAVMDVAVIGVPNDEFGEEVKAVVQLLAAADASPALASELITWCRDRLSHVKAPRSVDFREELPRHPTGKLYKRELRDEYWRGRDSRII
jgi:acyl-CoA synthetase (AMP-forming)/AMP-acid ligase II